MAPRKKPSSSTLEVNPYYFGYAANVAAGESIRQIATEFGVSPSTLSRQFRKIELLRDDAVFDDVIERVCRALNKNLDGKDLKMLIDEASKSNFSNSQVMLEARRILRRLAERDAVLLAKADLDLAGVFRQDGSKLQRLCVVSRAMVDEFILRDWVALEGKNAVGRYALTGRGRSALRRMVANENKKQGFAEAQNQYAAQHGEYGEKTIVDDGKARRLRVNFAENPISALARRKDKKGNPYLTPRQVAAGERIREDFEVAQIGPRVTQNWDRFLTGVARGDFGYSDGGSPTAADAHKRWTNAMSELGSGLGDIAFRVCCMLEGLETAERRLGWSARSGKIVLQIALERLADFYNIKA